MRDSRFFALFFDFQPRFRADQVSNFEIRQKEFIWSWLVSNACARAAIKVNDSLEQKFNRIRAVASWNKKSMEKFSHYFLSICENKVCINSLDTADALLAILVGISVGGSH